MIGFRIYYGDSSVYESSQCLDCLKNDWAEAPLSNVQEVVVFKEGGIREILCGGDYYYWKAGKLYYVPTGPEYGTWQKRPSGIRKGLVKYGQYCPNYELISAIAHADRAWPL